MNTYIYICLCFQNAYVHVFVRVCAATRSALDSGSCPPEQIKAPHLGAQRQIQHIEQCNSCKGQEGRQSSKQLPVDTGAQGCNGALKQAGSQVSVYPSYFIYSIELTWGFNDANICFHCIFYNCS